MSTCRVNKLLVLSGAVLSFVSGPATAPRAEVIKIMAANLTSGDHSAYESPGIRIFQGLKPDVVLIQEFSYESGTIRQLVDTAFGTGYYYYVESHSGGDLPNGIVSKWKLKSWGEWNDPYISNRDFAWAVIDIPGDKDLQVVSVHLKTEEAGTQNSEAIVIRNNVQTYFDNNQYIVVGGDLNTASRSASAINTFKTFLDADDHTPVDQHGNDNTNRNRSSPYDWVMPNGALDQYHTTLIIGSSSYPQGLVFDSHVYTPLAEVAPVQYGDSHVDGMQHMAVMKAFNIPGEPSPSPSPTFSPSPTPSPSPLPVILDSGDYNGDGMSDIAVFRPSSSLWAVRDLTRFYFGAAGDIPTPGDYNGDGTTDAGIYRPITALWNARDVTRFYFGAAADWPIPGDYNGDRRSDAAIFRSSQSLWVLRDVTRFYFGAAGDYPVPGDYRGDGTRESGIFRKITGLWAIKNFSNLYFGGSSDLPAAADYNGDGHTEIAVFRSYYSLWSIKGLTRVYFGNSFDQAQPADYNGDSTDDVGAFRPAAALWSIREISKIYYGVNGDIPLSR